MINKTEFLSIYNMTEKDLEEAQITWEELETIEKRYNLLEEYLREIGKNFVDDYLSEIKEMGIPVYMIPGNHEQYGHEDWEKFTGGERETFAICGDYLFILQDTYGNDLDPKEHSDGTYKPANLAKIKELMDEFPDKKVFLCSHFYDPRNESEEFKDFCKKEK